MGKRRRILQQVIFILMALTGVGCLTVWLVMRHDRPWLAFYVACCGGVMLVNLLLLLIFVRKNVK
jgi:drug/metabolite transporter superfamily protein YnfA